MLAASILDRLGSYQVLGFLNDVVRTGQSIGKYKKIEVVGTTEDLPRYLMDKDTFVFIAYVGLTKEKETYQKIEALNIPSERFLNIFDPTAVFPHEYCSIGNGVMFSPLSQLGPDTTISDNCILLSNSYVGHDSFLDRFAHLATNSVVGANVHVGKGVHVGSNATIKEKVRIGDFALIGAGAVVIKDVPENAIVAGNPAKILKLR